MRQYTSVPASQRFDRHVYRDPVSGCWLWEGALGEKGYGEFCMIPRVRSRVRAHRAAYELFVGPIPDGLHVLHRCDVRCCVNPAHLFIGTNTDNVRDCLAKGRKTMPSGDQHWTRRRKNGE